MVEKDGYGTIPDVEGGVAPEESPSLTNALVAEVIGTATLTQIGCGGLCAGLYLGTLEGTWQAAALWILGATLAVFMTGSISGGHLNPAVSFSFALIRPGDFSMAKLIPYWVAQLIGGIIAGCLNYIIYSSGIAEFEKTEELVRGSSEGIASAAAFGDYWSLSPGVANVGHAFFIEAFGTAFLVFCIFAATNPKNNVPSGAIAPIVGIAIGVMIVMLGNLTGAGINPARDLGPRIATSFLGWGFAAYTNAWVYIVAPLVGGPIGAAIADKVLFA
uniref:Aquaporin n=1 Tax=Helicotheca tamesis TaxID=374047 RepID=A0A7S2GQK5_9STRA|mmetsp:Transcript_10490/g.14704  ORF Transcript_10490/g.14704 Transcript_10490/m.14704 type:complete len:274 (+) Transcript_10490:58-879(+)|eukprot:CAMPEP_0185729398 /NCGR_PEP_ID=MMETSP1171-20130828/5681_1 /TAXON_ID=374046 /ORGANISM="Helicotheca tamensis, Strain CCMP826" /LENGTH=273 /DNA_ID=CAMNT_0028398227 /DNA_START=17 /DNA_END=838 /DNA_ORIENTATION=+